MIDDRDIGSPWCLLHDPPFSPRQRKPGRWVGCDETVGMWQTRRMRHLLNLRSSAPSVSLAGPLRGSWDLSPALHESRAPPRRSDAGVIPASWLQTFGRHSFYAALLICILLKFRKKLDDERHRARVGGCFWRGRPACHSATDKPGRALIVGGDFRVVTQAT